MSAKTSNDSRLAHLVPDFSFDGDDDRIIMKMSRKELCDQVKCNNKTVHCISKYTAKLYAREVVLEKEEWKRKYEKLEGEYKELKKNHGNAITLMSVYTSAMTSLKKDMMALFDCFDERSSPIIGEDVLVDSNGNIFNLPDLSAAVEETLKKTSDDTSNPYKCQKTNQVNKKNIPIKTVKEDGDDSVGSDDTTACSPPSGNSKVPVVTHDKTTSFQDEGDDEKSLDGSAPLLDEHTPYDPMYGLPATAQFAPLLGWKDKGGEKKKSGDEHDNAGQ